MGHMSVLANCHSRECVFNCKAAMLMFSFFQYWICLILLDGISKTCALEIQESRHISINRPVEMPSFQQLPKWVQFSTDYVRCFCNLPSCVTTAYMCKSGEGACFSDILEDGVTIDPNGVHGCTELLPKNKHRTCLKSGKTASTSKRKAHSNKYVFACCYTDMCNHIDNPTVRNFLNDSSSGAEGNDSGAVNVKSKQVVSLYTDSEVWFRAATIAVPICGAVILLALIMLAVRLLRSETTKNSIYNFGKTQDMWTPGYHKSNFSPGKCDGTYLQRQNNFQIDDGYVKKVNRNHDVPFCIPLLLQEENIQRENNSQLVNFQKMEQIYLKCSALPNAIALHNYADESAMAHSNNREVGKISYQKSLSPI